MPKKQILRVGQKVQRQCWGAAERQLEFGCCTNPLVTQILKSLSFSQILSHHTQNSDSGSVEKSSAWAWVGRDWKDRYLPKQGFCKSVKGKDRTMQGDGRLGRVKRHKRQVIKNKALFLSQNIMEKIIKYPQIEYDNKATPTITHCTNF